MKRSCALSREKKSGSEPGDGTSGLEETALWLFSGGSLVSDTRRPAAVTFISKDLTCQIRIWCGETLPAECTAATARTTCCEQSVDPDHMAMRKYPAWTSATTLPLSE